MKLFRFPPQDARVGLQQRFGGGDHPEEEFGLAGFLSTGANAGGIFFSRIGVIALAIVRADAGSRANELIDQAIVDCILRHTFGEPNDSLAEKRSSLFKVERMGRAPLPNTASFIGTFQAPKLQKVSIRAHVI